MTTSYFLNEEIRSWFTSRSRGRARTSLKPVTFPSLASKRYFCGTELSDFSCRCRFLDRGETYSRETTLRRLRCFQMVPLTTRKCKNNRRTIFVVSRAENTRYKILFISGPDFWTLLHYFRILSKEHSPSSFFFFKLSAIKKINIDTRARSETCRRYIIDFIADPRRSCEKNYSGKNVLMYRYE